jgi:spermidine synthase
LSDAAAEVEIIEGDARLMLDQEPDQRYDLLVLDAFSGDAVPAHLLTREALATYTRHLQPGGVLAAHISNLHFDLRPVVGALADEAGLSARILSFAGDAATAQTGSVWFVATAAHDVLQAPRVAELASPLPDARILWTDDFSDLFSLLK